MVKKRANPFLANRTASTLTQNYCPEDLTYPSCTLVFHGWDGDDQGRPGSARVAQARSNHPSKRYPVAWPKRHQAHLVSLARPWLPPPAPRPSFVSSSPAADSHQSRSDTRQPWSSGQWQCGDEPTR